MTVLRVLAALMTVAVTASAAHPSPPVHSARFDVAYEPERYAWRVGEAVVITPAVRFGSGSYQWSVSAGTLPPGLVLGPLGSVFGAPEVPGLYSWSILVRDVETKASATATAYVVVQ